MISLLQTVTRYHLSLLSSGSQGLCLGHDQQPERGGSLVAEQQRDLVFETEERIEKESVFRPGLFSTIFCSIPFLS